MDTVDLTAKQEKELTLKEELFCRFYASDREFFGNGVQSYMEAYDLEPKQYGSARSQAAVLLAKPSILAKVSELMDIYINDQVVDKELGFVIKQYNDLSAKVAAIREYNRVKRRVVEGPEQPQLIIQNPRIIAVINKLDDDFKRAELEE